MKFTTTEDYTSLMESIGDIDKSSTPPKKTLTESATSKNGLFEAIGSQSVEVELPTFKNLDLTALKFTLEDK